MLEVQVLSAVPLTETLGHGFLTASVVQLHPAVEALTGSDGLDSPQSTRTGSARQSSLQSGVGRGGGTDNLGSYRSSAGEDSNEVMHCGSSK